MNPTKRIIATLLFLIVAALIPTVAAAGGDRNGSLRRQGQPSAAQPAYNANAAEAMTSRRRRKLEDGGEAEEWAEQYFEEEAAEAEAAEAVWFDDDKYKEYEIEGRKNFWSMFNNPPASWTATQWGFFAGVLTVFSIVFCCIVKVFCPCC